MAIEEVIQLLETKLSGSLSLSQPDIWALREELAILVSTDKWKEAIGVQLTHQQHILYFLIIKITELLYKKKYIC